MPHAPGITVLPSSPAPSSRMGQTAMPRYGHWEDDIQQNCAQLSSFNEMGELLVLFSPPSSSPFVFSWRSKLWAGMHKQARLTLIYLGIFLTFLTPSGLTLMLLALLVFFFIFKQHARKTNWSSIQNLFPSKNKNKQTNPSMLIHYTFWNLW